MSLEHQVRWRRPSSLCPSPSDVISALSYSHHSTSCRVQSLLINWFTYKSLQSQFFTRKVLPTHLEKRFILRATSVFMHKWLKYKGLKLCVLLTVIIHWNTCTYRQFTHTCKWSRWQLVCSSVCLYNTLSLQHPCPSFRLKAELKLK